MKLKRKKLEKEKEDERAKKIQKLIAKELKNKRKEIE